MISVKKFLLYSATVLGLALGTSSCSVLPQRVGVSAEYSSEVTGNTEEVNFKTFKPLVGEKSYRRDNAEAVFRDTTLFYNPNYFFAEYMGTTGSLRLTDRRGTTIVSRCADIVHTRHSCTATTTKVDYMWKVVDDTLRLMAYLQTDFGPKKISVKGLDCHKFGVLSQSSSADLAYRCTYPYETGGIYELAGNVKYCDAGCTKTLPVTRGTALFGYNNLGQKIRPGEARDFARDQKYFKKTERKIRKNERKLARRSFFGI
ncbi:MAG: hypothetical protein ACP5N3_00530 [Candidatus Nanoarchaeia archaeon]